MSSITIRYSAVINGTRHSVDIPAERVGGWAVEWATNRDHPTRRPTQQDIDAIEVTWVNDAALYTAFWGQNPATADLDAWGMNEATNVEVIRINRVAFWTDESYESLRNGRFDIIRVEENEPGYWEYQIGYGTIAECRARVDALNDGNGITRNDALDILASSIAASRKRRGH